MGPECESLRRGLLPVRSRGGGDPRASESHVVGGMRLATPSSVFVPLISVHLGELNIAL